ncbi:arylamine N-acetyltransferase family protein [Pseudoxanthomonas japonensis]|uniref:arylamine N-acetyltransferase family protein n=1 Tax=Pseudoxanthomonas japonensis TaxID=69284 RepID=UPI001BCEBF8E|nr:arylamine N-acetyltransferase [Pseudoxanthomonas japonensis]
MPPSLTDIGLYLQRLGYDRSPPPTLETLRELQRRHTAEFPFETLSTLMRLPVSMDLHAIEHKLLNEGRGGYCYELNRAFLALLLALGFDARGITGRVVMGEAEGTVTARTHLLSLVTLDGVRYTVDVGFGGMVPTAPLQLDREDAQSTPHEPYRITRRGEQYLLQAQVAGDWRALYGFDLQPQAEIDYIVGNWYVSTHPDSPFLDELRVARTGPGWRRTLGNGSVALHRIGHASERTRLADVDAVITELREGFGLRVPDHHALAPAIARWLQAHDDA